MKRSVPKKARKWTSRKVLIDGYRRAIRGVDVAVPAINNYCNRISSPHDVRGVAPPPTAAFSILSGVHFTDALIPLLENGDWHGPLAKAVQYNIVEFKLQFYWHYRFRLLFPDSMGGTRKPIQFMHFDRMAIMMGFAFMMNWREEAEYLGYLTCAALRNNYQLVILFSDQHRRGQAFMIRLFCSLVGDADFQWPSFAYDVPEYEFLIETWRESDPEALRPALIAACERHVAQSYRETEKTFYDFSSYPRIPIEIMMLFRLREMMGLANLSIDHELFEAPFDRLPDTVHRIEDDELIRCTLARLRVDWPDFDEVVSLQSLKTVCRS